ncbi:MAG: carotenoid biosynthesis protein [Gemmatimonadota bacterium]|nr:carotenoid biosynthesis protein [Gemmatimonadota bacterium]
MSDRRGLQALWVFAVVSAIGYGLFGLDPTRVPDHPWVQAFYRASFALFARGQVALMLVVIGIALRRAAGWRWLPGLVLVFLLSLGVELLGTTTGLPFGPYHYTGLLGWRIQGEVPALIPLSWFAMCVPALGLGRAASPGLPRVGTWVVGAWLLTAWDLALDPAMSHLVPYWVWEVDGSWYGMPLLNLAGWFATGLFLLAALDLAGAGRWVDALPASWLQGYYVAVLATPVTMLLVAHAWPAVAVTVMGAGLPLAWLARRRSTAAAHPGAERVQAHTASLP